VILNDTTLVDPSQLASYWLSGADHRHLVYYHTAIVCDDPEDFARRLDRLAVDYVLN
jgi:hypothetical protein